MLQTIQKLLREEAISWFSLYNEMPMKPIHLIQLISLLRQEAQSEETLFIATIYILFILNEYKGVSLLHSVYFGDTLHNAV